MNILSSKLLVQFDADTKSLLILNPGLENPLQTLVNIREETYSAMSMDEAAEFVGSRILLLIPEMRAHFKDEIARLATSEKGKSDPH